MSYLRQVIYDANISFNCCNVIESNRDFIVSLQGEKMKSQRETSVLNQPCMAISYKRKSSRLRLKMLHLFWYFSCHIDDLSWWFALLAPEVCKLRTCLCAWRQIETLIWSIESLPLPYPLSSICSCSLQGIMDHRADCWPLHRGNSETAGHPSQGQTDVQVTWRGREWKSEERQERGGGVTEGERWCGRKGCRGMMEAEIKWINKLMQELRDFITNSLSASAVGQMLSTILRPPKSVSSPILIHPQVYLL